MKKLKIVSSNKLREMILDLEKPHGISIYQNSESYPDINQDYLLETTISTPEEFPNLIVSGYRGADLNDSDNAIRIYDFLGPLNRTQAADPRLWATLTHFYFWDYCKKRWPRIEKSEYILEHWFEKRGGGLGALRRNAISRLWWAAHLTTAPWEKDQEFEIFRHSNRLKYTEILLSKQQIFTDVLERSYGSNPKVRYCFLDALYRYLPKVNNSDDLSKTSSTKLRLMLKSCHLDALPVKDVKAAIDKIVYDSAEEISLNIRE